MDFEIPSLHDHQTDIVGRTRGSLIKHRSTIMQASTGVGKTRMAKFMIGNYLRQPVVEGRSGHALFTVHRRGLVFSAIKSFKEEPILPHGVIMSDVRPTWDQRVQVASIDTLLAWFVEGEYYSTTQTYDFIVFDECHSHLDKLKTFLECHSGKRKELGLNDPFVLGLSATPQAKGLGEVFGEIINGPKKQWLIDQGFLKPYRYFRATQGDMKKLVAGNDGEFTEQSVSDAMEGLAGDLVRDWRKFGQGRATIGFFPRLAHAKEALEMLRAEGINAEYVDGKTSDEEREKIFNRMRDGELDYICNVGVVERGTDIPRVGCIQMCTVVGTITRWLQMIGRGSRPHPDVDDCIVIDHGGNTKRLGFFEDEVNWTLDWDQRPNKTHEKKPSIECPKCQQLYRGGKCPNPNCGYEPTKKEIGKQGLTFNGAELAEVNKKEKKVSKTSEELLVSALYAAGRSKQTFGQALRKCYVEAEKLKINFVVPKEFVVAGKKYQTVPQNAEAERKSKVSALYPFTIGDYSAKDNPYLVGDA